MDYGQRGGNTVYVIIAGEVVTSLGSALPEDRELPFAPA
jgi:hypothetical protein